MINSNKYLIIKILTYISILSSSFDIAFNIEIAGFNFRLTQFSALPLILMYFIDLLANKHIKSKRINIYLLLWVITQFLFIFRSLDIKNAVGYFLWLLFNVLVVYSCEFYIDKAYSKEWLIKTYINSFVFVALLGLFQFIIYFFGVDFYVQQMYTKTIPRINGFSFEPSYYATYMIMGLVTIGYLLVKKDNSLFNLKELRNKFVIVLLAIILSNSRMGFMVAGVIVIYLFYLYIPSYLNKISKSKAIAVMGFVLPVAVVFGAMYYMGNTNFFRGLSLKGNGNDWSSSGRINALKQCFEAFKESPILGYSLGGVDPILAKYQGLQYTTSLNGQGSTLGELLLASGIVGLIPLILFVYKLLFTKSNNNTTKALKIALLFELIMLCMNQNILRPYLWWHIAIYLAISGSRTNNQVNYEKE